jgi:hypothetical protein
MHRLGGLLGLPRQLIEFRQRVIGRIGLHTRSENSSEEHDSSYRSDCGSFKDTGEPMRAVEPQDLSFKCRNEAVSNYF